MLGNTAAPSSSPSASATRSPPPPPYSALPLTPSAPQTHAHVDHKPRTRLPAPSPPPVPVSLGSLLQRTGSFSGDLSISMPAALNVPLSALQSLAEEFEYAPLLDRAGKAIDPVDRIALVAALAVSGYAHARHKVGRKPFNPMLGETYEVTREDKGFRFVAEKVAHHPLVMALHVESLMPNHYTISHESHVVSHFGGKDLTLEPNGSPYRVNLFARHEIYTYDKVPTTIHAALSGRATVSHTGELEVLNHMTGHRCVLEFKDKAGSGSGMWPFGGSRSKRLGQGKDNEVEGTVYDPQGNVVGKVAGRWDSHLERIDPHSGGLVERLWQVAPWPENCASQYGFTQFAVELNDLPPSLIPLLPPTDSRFRPDQRLLERGYVDAAEREKKRLERLQRDRRKQGVDAAQRWFERRPDRFREDGENGGDGNTWTYKGGYWERPWVGEKSREGFVDIFGTGEVR